MMSFVFHGLLSIDKKNLFIEHRLEINSVRNKTKNTNLICLAYGVSICYEEL